MVRAMTDVNIKLKASNVDVFYDEKQALKSVSIDILKNQVTFIGPSGCGKSTFLRCFNRMNDVIPSARVSGEILLDGTNIINPDVDPVLLRAQSAWCSRKPTRFQTIYENVAYGPKIRASARMNLISLKTFEKRGYGLKGKTVLAIKPPVPRPAAASLHLRVIAVNPTILLMDEPCSALDPIATAVIEDLIESLREIHDYHVTIPAAGRPGHKRQRIPPWSSR